MRCEGCPLQQRACIDPAGNAEQPLFALVGEAPGFQEVKEGKPFVGKSGQLLKAILAHYDIPREQCYVTNAIMCHPPENRTPAAQELNACKGRLIEELKTVQPRFIITLGATAAKVIFNAGKFSDVRGKISPTIVQSEREWTAEAGTFIPGLATLHPAACLYPGGDTLLPTILRDILKAKRRVLGGQTELQTLKTEVHVISGAEGIGILADAVSHEGQYISFDWETTGTNPRVDVGFCLGISWCPGKAAVIPMEVLRDQISVVRRLFLDWQTKLPTVAFNAPFDSRFNARSGLPDYFSDDPMLMHYVLDERPQPRNLEVLSMDYCDAEPYESQMLEKYQCTKNDMIQKVPWDVIYEYCGRDADYGGRLFLLFSDELKTDEKLYKVYKEILIPGARSVAELQQNGIWVDRAQLAKVTAEYQERRESLLKVLQDLSGNPSFNPNSPKQVAEFLWDEMKIPEPDLYGRKERSVDSATRESLLEYLDEDHPAYAFVKALDDYKTVQTMLSRYLEPLPGYIEDDGRVRCQWHLDRTETGRLSTTSPAIHQIPREGSIRSIFSAPPGHTLVQADYSKGEIHWAAFYGNDAKLIEMLKAGVDFHALMASLAFKVPLEKVTKAQRQAAKKVSFGILYGMSDAKLAKETGLPKAEATAFITNYKKLMPGVMAWIIKTHKDVVEQRYVESFFGRRRRFHLITDDNLHKLQREAVNMPIQSGLSDLCLLSMNELRRRMKEQYPEAKIIITQHDSLVIECPTPIAMEIARLMKKVMETPPFESPVPFPIEVKIGQRWGEGEEVLTA